MADAVVASPVASPASSIMTHFADLPDPRSPLGRRHGLSDLLTIAVCAVVCGADGWVQVEQFAHAKRKWFATFLSLPYGVPSHDTFGRVFAMLDPDALERCFVRWTRALAATGGKLVSIDGKSLRRSFAHAWDKSGMCHLVSAFVGANRMVLGQLAVDGTGNGGGGGGNGGGGGEAEEEERRRGNEITAIPKLLELLDLTGATVSIDAIGCQRDIATKIRERGGDYVLCLKQNQPTLHAKVKALLDEAILENLAAPDMPGDYYEEVDGAEHGRIETRRVWCTARVDHLRLDEPWPGLASVAAVERVREVLGKDKSTARREAERHYYISSLEGHDARRMAAAVRGHWSVENQLHWHLDVSFGEDQRRVRTGYGAENFSRLARLALNLLQRDTRIKVGVKTKRLRAGWDHDYLLSLLTG
jgi:predicted transposase YbfD/YdcC